MWPELEKPGELEWGFVRILWFSSLPKKTNNEEPLCRCASAKSYLLINLSLFLSIYLHFILIFFMLKFTLHLLQLNIHHLLRKYKYIAYMLLMHRHVRHTKKWKKIKVFISACTKTRNTGKPF